MVNIFNFATSELTQDAFICWLIANAKEEATDDEMKNIGKALVTDFFSKISSIDLFSPSEIKISFGPERQFQRADVYFEASVGGCTHGFIVEDKTWSCVHSDQLQRYKRDISENRAKEVSLPGSNIHGIYFKTGYLYDFEKGECDKVGYSTYSSTAFYKLLSNSKSDNPILKMYIEYLKTTFVDPLENIDSVLKTRDGYKHFEEQYIQYEFLKRLAAGTKEGERDIGKGNLYFNKNMGGSPWTQWRFIKYDRIYADKPEKIFYRIDGRKNPETGRWGYYLRINQYADIGTNEAIKSLKMKRLEIYRETFNSLDWGGVKFAAPHNKGTKESEICILFFNQEVNTPERVLDKIPAIHKSFVTSIRRNRGLATLRLSGY